MINDAQSTAAALPRSPSSAPLGDDLIKGLAATIVKALKVPEQSRHLLDGIQNNIVQALQDCQRGSEPEALAHDPAPPCGTCAFFVRRAKDAVRESATHHKVTGQEFNENDHYGSKCLFALSYTTDNVSELTR